MAICKYCNQEKQLIKAHILPRKFYTGYEQDGYGALNSKGYTRKNFQSGVIDRNILCTDCDNNILGEYDNEAYKLLLNIDKKKVKSKWQEFDVYFYLEEEFDYEKIRKFFIAILWRASISTLDCMNIVKLGPYEEIALKLLKDEIINDNLFKVIIAKTQDNTFTGIHMIKQSKNVLGQSRIYTIYFDSYVALIIIKYKKFNNKFIPLENLFLNKNRLIIIESNAIDDLKMNEILKLKKITK
jgi:hypothetical protein